MNELHYQRIDKGTKRDYRALARRQPRTEKGTFGLIHPPELKAKAILDALNSLPFGETTDSIAQRHQVPGSTLRAWLLADDSAAADVARAMFLAHELAIRANEIDTSADPLTLARAREAFRAWAWIAERRNAKIFGQKQEITHISADLGDRLRRARERVIEGQIVDSSQPSVDKKAEEQDTSVMSNPPALPKK